MKILKIIFPILLLVSFVLYYTVNLNQHYFHEDEHSFIQGSQYFYLFFLKKENFAIEAPPLYDQPPLAYYVYGLTLYAQGHKDLIKEQKEVSFNNAYIDKVVLGYSTKQKSDIKPWWIRLENEEGMKMNNFPLILIPSIKMIWQARKAAVFFSLGGLLSMYFLGNEIGGVITGLLSMLILGLNPLMFLTSRRAMADPILLFFLLINVLLIIYSFKLFIRNKVFDFLLLSFLIGMNIAFATATKLNGGMTLIIWFMSILAILINVLVKANQKRKNFLLLSKGFLISFLVAFSIFILLNPYLYSNPFKNSINMIRYRISTSKGQQDWSRGNFYGPIFSLSDKANAVFRQTLTKEGEWNNFELAGIDLSLFIIGLGLLFLMNHQKNFEINQVSSMMVLIWVITTIIAVILYIPLNWDRYYLPVVPTIALVQAYSLSRILEFTAKKLWGLVKK